MAAKKKFGNNKENHEKIRRSNAESIQSVGLKGSGVLKNEDSMNTNSCNNQLSLYFDESNQEPNKDNTLTETDKTLTESASFEPSAFGVKGNSKEDNHFPTEESYNNLTDKHFVFSDYSHDNDFSLWRWSVSHVARIFGYGEEADDGNSFREINVPLRPIIFDSGPDDINQRNRELVELQEEDHQELECRRRQEEGRKRREPERHERKHENRERLEAERKDKERREKEDFEHQLFDLSEKIETCTENNFFALYSEKKPLLGEDSVPLIYHSQECSVVGVFDGMGGAGAAEYSTFTQGSKTGAYLSSRIVRALCLDTLMEKGSLNDVKSLEAYISKYLTKLLVFWNIKPSGIRSAFVRILPTTLAVVEAHKSGKFTDVVSYWAGDSRNYILLSSGLRQISIDDLRLTKDPLENLRSDDALSNCICQDKPFTINHHYCGRFEEPVIILSATDGCFGYLQTPMHFEYIILDALRISNNCREWCDNIIKKLEPISGDDFTIGLQIVSGDFDYWKQIMIQRYLYLKENFISPIDNLRTAYEQTVLECERLKNSLYNSITDLWKSYKQDYMFNHQSNNVCQ